MGRVFSFDGNALPMPKIEFGFQDLSAADSGRSVDGTMQKKMVCQKKTVKATWEMLTDSECANILSAVKPQVYGTLIFPDPYTGTDGTITAYTGDVTCKQRALLNDVCYWDVNFDFIEQ